MRSRIEGSNANYSVLNRFIFRPPTPPTYGATDFPNHLIDIDGIACILVQCRNARFFMIQFHGNAADMGSCYHMAKYTKRSLNVAVLTIEYPGYGITKGYACEDSANYAAEVVYDYVRNVLKVPANRIILFGTSLGTGIAIELAHKVYTTRNEKLALLILISPFTSILDIVNHKAGRIISSLFNNQFVSIDKIDKILCRTLFFHGMKDGLIPFDHSVRLAEGAKKGSLFLHEEMTHYDGFEFEDDVLRLVKYVFDTQKGDRLAPSYSELKYINMEGTSEAEK